MPLTNEYHIYIHGTGEGKSSPVAKNDEKKTEKIGKIVSFGQIRHAADKYLAHEITQVQINTGANEFSQRLSYLQSVGSQAVSSSLMIAAAFKVSNPVGVMTLILQAVDKATSIIYNVQDVQAKRSLEDESIRLANIRAGLGRRNGK